MVNDLVKEGINELAARVVSHDTCIPLKTRLQVIQQT